MWLKGINQWVFAPTTGWEAVLRETRAAGFQALELNLEAEGPVLTVETPETRLRQFRTEAEAAGVALPSVSTALYWTYPLTDNNPQVRSRAMEIARRQIAAAAALGAEVVLIVPGLVTPEVSYDAAYDRAQEALSRLAPEAKAAGVTIGVENVWNKFLLSPLEFRRFLDEIGSPAVGAYFDAGNVLVNGFPAHWIQILGHRIKRVHIKDFRVQVGTLDGFVPLLAGDMDWSRTLGALRAIQYQGPITVEVAPYPLTAVSAAFDQILAANQ
jgi:L-ribulose-5-phosphate 3-epimerase